MKLIDRNKLLEQLCTYKGKRKKQSVCLAYHKLVEHCELSPADLKTLDLAALGVLGKLKSIYRQLKDKGVCDISTGLLLDRIEHLESAADLEAAKKILEEAKAWEITVRDHELGVIEEKSIIKEARDELEKGEVKK